MPRKVLALFTVVLLSASFGLTAAPRSNSNQNADPSQAGMPDAASPSRPAKKTWRVAQNVSEKEAFELAKDVGTIQAWNAFLKEYPRGFRAEIAKSYIQKLKTSPSGSTSRGGQHTPSGPSSTYIKAANLSGAYRITARDSKKTYLNNNDTGIITVGPNDADRTSGHWIFEAVPGSRYVRIRNRWMRTYLIVDDGVVQAEQKSKSDKVTHWTLEAVPGSSEFVIIRNRLTGQYLSPAKNSEYPFAGSDKPNGQQGHWQLVEQDGAAAIAKDPATKSKKRKATTKKTRKRKKKRSCRSEGGSCSRNSQCCSGKCCTDDFEECEGWYGRCG